jgi:hypothetical protein
MASCCYFAEGSPATVKARVLAELCRIGAPAIMSPGSRRPSAFPINLVTVSRKYSRFVKYELVAHS